MTAEESPVETSTPTFDPFAEGFFDDPYPTYARMRAVDPVHASPLGPWILFAHADAARLLRDPTLSVDVRKAIEVAPHQRRRRDELLDEIFPGRERREDTSILNIDPPDHTRLRRLVSKVFTRRRIEDLRPLVRDLVQEHLDAVAGAGRMDVIADVAFPLPFTVISEMLGMPEARFALAEAAIYLSTAPKSRTCADAIDAAVADIEGGRVAAVPTQLRDRSYAGAERIRHGEGYRMPRSEGDGRAQDYGIEIGAYYGPGESGYEREVRERTARWDAASRDAGPEDES